jgi:peptidoglycan LD-endopeptidase CwlK
MPKFSAHSLAELNTCDPRLVKVCQAAIMLWDFTVLDGHRTKEEQEYAFNTGRSKLHWPEGKHCADPSLAVDCAPFPVDWSNTKRFLFFAGKMMGLAACLGVNLRSGCDWNGNGDPRDESFADLVHLEIIEMGPRP